MLRHAAKEKHRGLVEIDHPLAEIDSNGVHAYHDEEEGAACTLLAGYWLAMRYLQVPGFPAGTLTPEGNFANYVDRLLFLPGQLYEKYGDPEGLFSTIPAIATDGASVSDTIASRAPSPFSAAG